MNSKQWEVFKTFRETFRAKCEEWNEKYSSILLPLQKEAADNDKTPDYPHENAIVYNTALDELTQDSVIKYIVIGDNPGKDEQLNANRRYLVGQAGKLGNRFFTIAKCFNTDFRKNVIILNKTPIHSAKTKQLKYISKKGGKELAGFILETQKWMAEQTAMLHITLSMAAGTDSVAPEIWLVGYSELKNNGIFNPYKEALKEPYTRDTKSIEYWTDVYVFQHFSMNRFTVDLNEFMQKHSSMPLPIALHALGHMHKGEIFSTDKYSKKEFVKREFSEEK